MGLKVAVVGATGLVGQEVLNIMAERGFLAEEIFAVASRQSQGQDVSYGEDKSLKVKALDHFDFSLVDLAFFAIDSKTAKTEVKRAVKEGAIVIDNSSAFRMDPDVPLVVPEVNAAALDAIKGSGIIANPNCAAAQLVVALKPLHDEATIKRVVMATYQSTSGAGKAAMDELFDQTRKVFVNDTFEPEHFTKQIAFNVIPHIDVFDNDGNTGEETKVVQETRKIMDADIKVTTTCVRVPTFVGHAEAVNIEFEDDISPGSARKILREAPGCMVIDKREDGGYITPTECVGEFATYVSRIRRDESVEHGLNIWVVSDNLRKGAALNAVQIAESLINRGILSA